MHRIIQIKQYRQMKGFQYEEVGGLFTFYRQQAEYEQQKQQQKREKALKKKQKQIQAQQLRKQLQQAEQKQKQKQKESEQISQKQKYISSSPNLEPRRQDYIEKAKRYIKELQQSRSNKLMLSHRKRMRRHSNFKQGQEVKFKEEDRAEDKVDKPRYGNDKMEGLFSLQQSEIFVNKKDFVKMNYMMLFDKEAVIPKQFKSIQIFDTNKARQLDSRHYSLQLLRKQPSHNRQSVQKLPKIKQDSYSSIHPSLSLLKKDPKKSLNALYNPMDIILNNEKFKIIDKEGKNNKNNKIFRKYQSYNIRNQTVQFVDAKLVAVNKIAVK